MVDVTTKGDDGMKNDKERATLTRLDRALAGSKGGLKYWLRLKGLKSELMVICPYSNRCSLSSV